MKTVRGLSAGSLAYAIVLIASGADAATETMMVTEGGIDFSVQYKEGSSKPYRVKFVEDGVSSTFKFNDAGQVKNIKAGTEKYLVKYKSNGDLSKVKRTSSDRRHLEEEEDNGRRLYACGDCEETWDMVCDEGVPTVCDLVGYSSSILEQGEASIATMCETFGSACSRSGGMEACAGQCEDGGTDDEVELNACLDSTSEDFRCTLTAFFASMGLSFEGCGMVDADMPGLIACIESVGRLNVDLINLDDNNFTTLPVELLSGLTNLGDFSARRNQLESLPPGTFQDQTGYFDQLWLTDNKLTTLPEGVFDDNGLFSLGLNGNPDLQCVPATGAYEVYVDSEDMRTGTCGCEPASAVMCESGTSCQPGTEGYTCE